MSAAAEILRDKEVIREALEKSPLLHIYEIGDLDDRFFPHATFHGLSRGGRVEAVALLYDPGSAVPVLLALDDPPATAMCALVRAMRPALPRRFDAHLSSGVLEALGDGYAVRSRGLHDKMALTDPSKLDPIDTRGVDRLGPGDLDALEALYAESYPGNWFDPRMLATGQFFGIRREGGGLASVAGVHVFAPAYRAAALGNITTHPGARGRGLGARTTAALCRSLLASVDRIGLNVDAANAPAIACYRRLGFTKVGEYHEVEIEARDY